MDNVEILKQGYKFFAEGNIPAVLELFNSEIVWDECQGFPYIEGDGIFTGPQGIAQGVFSHIPENYNNFQIEIDELFGCDDRVVMVGHYTGVWKKTGKQFKANATHVWKFKDGKATQFFQAADSAEIMN